jgi:hypothetical protein
MQQEVTKCRPGAEEAKSGSPKLHETECPVALLSPNGTHFFGKKFRIRHEFHLLSGIMFRK